MQPHLSHSSTPVTPTAQPTTILQLSSISCTTLTFFSITPHLLMQYHISSRHLVYGSSTPSKVLLINLMNFHHSTLPYLWRWIIRTNFLSTLHPFPCPPPLLIFGTSWFTIVTSSGAHASAGGVEHAHVHCTVKHRPRHIHEGESHIPMALSGCSNWSSPTLILVGLTGLHAFQLSSHSQTKAITQLIFFQTKHLSQFTVVNTLKGRAEKICWWQSVSTDWLGHN